MSIAAFRSSPIADSTVPLTTGFTGLAIGLGDLFLFNCAAVSGTIFLEVTGFEVSETVEFGQFNMLDFPNVAADGFMTLE